MILGWWQCSTSMKSPMLQDAATFENVTWNSIHMLKSTCFWFSHSHHRLNVVPLNEINDKYLLHLANLICTYCSFVIHTQHYWSIKMFTLHQFITFGMDQPVNQSIPASVGTNMILTENWTSWHCDTWYPDVIGQVQVFPIRITVQCW